MSGFFFFGRGQVRYSFYVYGFNVYHALQSKPQYRKFKWFDYRRLSERLIRSQDTISDVVFFTAITEWKPDKAKRHRQYIKALRSSGVEVVRGRFMKKTTTCHVCGKRYLTHEEKRTDVNIALRILSDAIEDLYDVAIIISADSDLIPAIKSVEKLAPDKRIGVMTSIGRSSFDLRQNAHFRVKST